MKAQKPVSRRITRIISERSEKAMTAIIQVCLWLFVLNELYERLSPKLDIMKKRIKYKRTARSYMRLSENAENDYKAGFFYGKAKQFEQKLKETRYFYYD